MSVRVTRKVRRVIDHLAKGPATAPEISSATNINFGATYVILDRLEQSGWVIYEAATRRWSLTDHGRACRDEAAEAVHTPPPPPQPEVKPRPRGPRPPYKKRFHHQ